MNFIHFSKDQVALQSLISLNIMNLNNLMLC
ncbi:hypothetical protein FWP32_05680 [Vibrio alginolyticus]|uniref:Uncharacterized protein n=1 Tax=Vibrio alginolyticus TaxID=663 RepID=A0A7Y4B273_VIBAL|nr:hypothetical protein AL541_01910 [Vibrio alginolyticus]NAW54422.1 hypothetical protein [Vibrio sp. V41_P2S12T139]NAW93269.1 hypothetical protein [Vibrio sp. V42_P2S4T144]NNN41262.1 hypothetical protein [Vibrio sp. 2-2(2)]NNN53126.1 hypothetical protein [Vibrio sp. 2-2(7)]NNN62753.1 hypothetical protein [Vibrio sp. 2-1(7)]NNN86355.1 hypothetical protein [Vibrio sp. 2-2(9)]NNO04101.1 hypothetical protein [Vibrio sp. 7-5(1-a)]QCO88804.1 hypothetical protein D3H41_22735 [Vibrio neocaledonicu